MRWFEGNVTQIEIDSHPNGYILYERINKIDQSMGEPSTYQET